MAKHEEIWLERLREAGSLSWSLTEKPRRARLVLEAYFDSRAAATALVRRWGGRARRVDVREWLKAYATAPTRIGSKLKIVHANAVAREASSGLQLYIPHGLAFGSGEHGTTYMLLRELCRRERWSATSVLDLGTGSGVLALAARLFGARKIVATDFDAEAVRTARQNEALNFDQPLIRWRCADVKKLRATPRYDLVLANLFSEILAEAAPQIAGCVKVGGELWLSGILKSQQEGVIAAYRKQGLKLIETRRRGKWILLRWQRGNQDGTVGGAKKATQTK